MIFLFLFLFYVLLFNFSFNFFLFIYSFTPFSLSLPSFLSQQEPLISYSFSAPLFSLCWHPRSPLLLAVGNSTGDLIVLKIVHNSSTGNVNISADNDSSSSINNSNYTLQELFHLHPSSSTSSHSKHDKNSSDKNNNNNNNNNNSSLPLYTLSFNSTGDLLVCGDGNGVAYVYSFPPNLYNENEENLFIESIKQGNR